MKIHLIHGIHTPERENTVAKLQPFLEKETRLPVLYHSYGFALAVTTRIFNPGRAKRIAKHVEPGDIAVGHSNGACLIWMMAKYYGARFTGVVLINPALDEDKGFSRESVSDFVHVYYNEGDKAVPFAEAFMSHPWGQMGKTGYIGTDPRVKNFDCSNTPHLLPVWGHSHIFERLDDWGPFIGKQIKNELEIVQNHQTRNQNTP